MVGLSSLNYRLLSRQLVSMGLRHKHEGQCWRVSAGGSMLVCWCVHVCDGNTWYCV